MIEQFKKVWYWVLISVFGLGIAYVAVVDAAIQTQAEVTNIIETRQEVCFQETGKYCQFIKGRVNPNLFGTDIKPHDYRIIVNVWEGGKGELHYQQGYTIRYIEPVIIQMATTT